MKSDSALILVDLQNDFLPGGALAVAEGDQVIAIANRVQAMFEMVVASKDWHPLDHASFAANHPGEKVGDVIDLHGLPQVLWPVHCVQNTSGAEFAPGLETARIARVFLKGTDREIDSYSAFYDNGHRKSTGMREYLKSAGIRRAFILGLATDYCVKFTVMDALREDFEVTLIEDGCRGVNLRSGDADRAKEEIRRQGGRIIQSRAIMSSAFGRDKN